jgi:hypothetical protein
MEIVYILIAAVVGYGIPIYIGVQSWRNGHREWVWATILVTFGIYGIMGIWVFRKDIKEGDLGVVVGLLAGFACLLAFYILAWVKTRKPLAIPIGCPKCGKSSKVRQRVIRDQMTGKNVQSRLLGSVCKI